ncbi:MAG: flagellar hook protein FlgE [Methylobacter sp.]|uniref:Flagellar hook protein FlgE n=1 Tax=Candidatus Methylobacter titanis TaxID=3053457 RepID=A0AA43Q5K0_9GAMM|nr:flagellar hook protein FlgE [Candidatus Methylobacter titanis]MDI1291394.1 flagellar hook protein FlgE [Candidatus Methylobacter titanis]
MGFATALSGLKAASTSLQVTGNNIANSQTTGFKESRAEFADVYASSIGGVSKTQPGSGVKVTEVAQQFNQGNIESTQNSLDLAVSGNGFFVLADTVNLPDKNNPNAPVDPSVPSAYTRNGAFQLDSSGNVVNDKGQYLLAFAANGTTAAEGFSVGVFRPLTIDTAQGLPNATENINMKLNINAAAAVPPTAAFDPTDPLSYNNTTSVTTYDIQGNAHIASTYYVKTATANEWDAYLFLDDFGITTGGPAVPPGGAPPSTVVTPVNTPGTPMKLAFTSTGVLDTVNAVPATKVDFGAIDLSDIDPNISVDPMAFDLDFFGTTQFATPFSVNGLDQDGLPAGNLTGIDVDATGVVFARYSNGGSKALGQVALARFPSNQALAKLGDTSWATTSTSGAPIFGAAGDNNFGGIQSSALEGSNVDLSEQLVKLIIAQQAYQANSQTITTEKTLIQTILNA